MKRDSSIDLFKLVCMFLVCLIHSISYQDARWNHWISNLSRFSVVGFALASGFCGVDFRPSKVIRLVGLGLVCAMISSSFSPCGDIMKVFRSYWFLHAYLLMMCLAPMVNICFYRLKDGSVDSGKIKMLIPCVALTYIWGFSAAIPGVHRYIPLTDGLAPFGGLTLLGSYVIGRCYREFDWQDKLCFKKVVLTLIVCMLVVVASSYCSFAGFTARYNSPFQLGVAICVFWIMRKMRIEGVIKRIVMLATPSVFSIYLLHCTPSGYRCLGELETIFSSYGINLYVIFMLDAVIVFSFSLVLDVPRRTLAAVSRKPLEKFYSAIDCLYCYITK